MGSNPSASENATRDLSRRSFLASLLAIIGSGLAINLFYWRDKIPFLRSRKETIEGPDFKTGHRLRGKKKNYSPPASLPVEKVDTLVIGAGISGLSAGWHLLRNNYSDFKIIDLDRVAGGNSQSSQANGLAYPAGAHYLPLPTEESVYVKQLLSEMGLLEKGRYRSENLCAEPVERLYLYRQWQRGIYPLVGASDADQAEKERFDRLINQYRLARGSDGRPAFTIPIDLSSRDPRFTGLDKITMARFLRERGFKSHRLLWYVNYACRDDFGAGLDTTSAWAGLHYFAARPKGNGLLTWPEGNGHLVNYLKQVNSDHLLLGHLCYHVDVQRKKKQVTVSYKEGFKTIEARQVIFAAPKFLLPFIFNKQPFNIASFEYSPWLVANVLMKGTPATLGEYYAWDNVIYGGSGLGYIVADHQYFGLKPLNTIWTYYHPLWQGDTRAARRQLLAVPGKWADHVVKDLEIAHPDIRQYIDEMRFFYWGHAMIRPRPGFIWGGDRKQFYGNESPVADRIFYAHSDLSGVSLFEEAQYQGVRAAEELLSAVT